MYSMIPLLFSSILPRLHRLTLSPHLPLVSTVSHYRQHRPLTALSTAHRAACSPKLVFTQTLDSAFTECTIRARKFRPDQESTEQHRINHRPNFPSLGRLRQWSLRFRPDKESSEQQSTTKPGFTSLAGHSIRLSAQWTLPILTGPGQISQDNPRLSRLRLPFPYACSSNGLCVLRMLDARSVVPAGSRVLNHLQARTPSNFRLPWPPGFIPSKHL
ncbi:hypothetical protein IWX91DRAFT_158465 [Phyllosticta citricarpa]